MADYPIFLTFCCIVCQCIPLPVVSRFLSVFHLVPCLVLFLLSSIVLSSSTNSSFIYSSHLFIFSSLSLYYILLFLSIFPVCLFLHIFLIIIFSSFLWSSVSWFYWRIVVRFLFLYYLFSNIYSFSSCVIHYLFWVDDSFSSSCFAMFLKISSNFLHFSVAQSNSCRITSLWICSLICSQRSTWLSHHLVWCLNQIFL